MVWLNAIRVNVRNGSDVRTGNGRDRRKIMEDTRGGIRIGVRFRLHFHFGGAMAPFLPGVRPGKLHFVVATYLDHPKAARFRQSSPGLKMPAGVMMPVTSSPGVTSKPGFRASLVGLATRT